MINFLSSLRNEVMEMDNLILQPKETMMISETAGLLQPEKVAETILTDAIVSIRQLGYYSQRKLPKQYSQMQ